MVITSQNEKVSVFKIHHFTKTNGTSFAEIAWDIMKDVIEWNSSDFVDEYSTSGDQNYRDYFEFYCALFSHEYESPKSIEIDGEMEIPCKHDNQPSVCYECDEK